jgi:nucleotide-binding universal stress UspA family protein
VDVGPIVVGVDGSEASGRALSYACGLASRSATELVVVHVRRRPMPSGLPLVDQDPFAPAEELEAAVRRLAEEVVAGCEVGWRFVARDGDPAEELHGVAQNLRASMLVVSTRGAGVGARLHRIAEGSVSSWLLRHEETPLLIVR